MSYWREYRKELLAADLCPYCKGDMDRARGRCGACIIGERVRSRRRYARRCGGIRMPHRCRRCGEIGHNARTCVKGETCTAAQ
jgi:hypothetical protein